MPRTEHADEGLFGLVLKILPIAPPVLDEVQPRIQDCGRVAGMRPMLDPDGLRERIRPIKGGLVARRAAHVPL